MLYIEHSVVWVNFVSLQLSDCSIALVQVCARSIVKTKRFFHSVRLHLVVGRVAEYSVWLIFKNNNVTFGETKTVSTRLITGKWTKGTRYLFA